MGDSGAGGAISLTSGSSTATNGGAMTISTGAASGGGNTGSGGVLTLSAGAAGSSGNGGNIVVQPGASASGTNGDVKIKDSAGTSRVAVSELSVSVTAVALSLDATGTAQINGATGVEIDGSTTGNTITGTTTMGGNLVAQGSEITDGSFTSTSTCTKGQIGWDADYMYICVATNTWKRSALATWS